MRSCIAEGIDLLVSTSKNCYVVGNNSRSQGSPPVACRAPTQILLDRLRKMFTFMFWSFCLCVLSDGARAHSYDQSQSGDFNVQVDLKDLHIIALMKDGKEEYVVS